MKRTIPLILLLFLVSVSYTGLRADITDLVQGEKIKIENDSLKNTIINEATAMNNKIFTFLTFQKEDAEQAMNFYIELFDDSEIITIKRWGKGAPGKEGTIMHATFKLNGNMFMCSDSPPVHAWDFTPAVSNFVECEDENELERLFTTLSENGEITMPLNNYGFSQRFGWVIDQFGVSWQLNLN